MFSYIGAPLRVNTLKSVAQTAEQNLHSACGVTQGKVTRKHPDAAKPQPLRASLNKHFKKKKHTSEAQNLY
jgi:hypothetical protein